MNASIDTQSRDGEDRLARVLVWFGVAVTVLTGMAGLGPESLKAAGVMGWFPFLLMSLYLLGRKSRHKSRERQPFRFSLLYTMFAPIGAIILGYFMLTGGLNFNEVATFMVKYVLFIAGTMTILWGFLYFFDS